MMLQKVLDQFRMGLNIYSLKKIHQKPPPTQNLVNNPCLKYNTHYEGCTCKYHHPPPPPDARGLVEDKIDSIPMPTFK